MQSLKTLLGELFGLFVDDGSLAIGLILWMAVVWFFAPQVPIADTSKAGILVLGFLMILLENVARTARRRRKT